MLKALLEFQRLQAARNGPQKQTVDPAASNSDTLVNLAVAVYPIHLDQYFSTFRKTVRTLLFNENFIRTTNTRSDVHRKFSWGRGSFSGKWWSFLFFVRCL